MAPKKLKSLSFDFEKFVLGCFVLLASYSAPAETIPLKLLTLNVYQFAYGIESTRNEPRAEELVRRIRENQKDFDVIAFQEMWSNVTRAGVYQQIQALYPYRYEDDQWGALLGLGFTSGLAIYSKYPIVKHMIYTYKNYRGDEDFAKKGLLGVELNIKGKPVYVFTTHLQAGEGNSLVRFFDRNKPSTIEMSALQFLEAKEQMESFILERDAPVFWIGDFNIIAGSQAYQNDLALLDGAVDTFDAAKSNYTGTNRSMTDRIDYIFNLGKVVPGYSVI
jgi:endonuclease/exonuclease/phosphatase family metal-dependent hydrolase